MSFSAGPATAISSGVALTAFSFSDNAAAKTNATTALKHYGSALTRVMTGTILALFFSFDASNDTSGDGVIFEIRYGTGAAPAGGDAATGTGIMANSASVNGVAAALANFNSRASLVGHVTGLTKGTTYWIDFVYRAAVGGIAKIQNVQIVGLDIT